MRKRAKTIHRVQRQYPEIMKIIGKDILAGLGDPSRNSADEPLDERSDVGNQQGDGASQ
jgi:hypothetical protein